ncbi:unnamed protein product [Durusdinium trenchii]|uniref:Uncharacterized protein n=1 Tax=Durusdinium trenchii TaxID=1381693 RepID=A0ABP0LYT7_9DINO
MALLGRKHALHFTLRSGSRSFGRNFWRLGDKSETDTVCDKLQRCQTPQDFIAYAEAMRMHIQKASGARVIHGPPPANISKSIQQKSSSKDLHAGETKNIINAFIKMGIASGQPSKTRFCRESKTWCSDERCMTTCLIVTKRAPK